MNVTEIRPGNYFIDEDNLYLCLDILLNKTAMRKMVAAIKAKNMRTGSIVQISRNSGYDVEPVRLDKKKMSYLYDSGDSLVFMDQVTYDQVEIAKSKLEWEMNFLVADAEIEILAYEDEILGISLPASVALTIVCADEISDCTLIRASFTSAKEMEFLKVQLKEKSSY